MHLTFNHTEEIIQTRRLDLSLPWSVWLPSYGEEPDVSRPSSLSRSWKDEFFEANNRTNKRVIQASR